MTIKQNDKQSSDPSKGGNQKDGPRFDPLDKHYLDARAVPIEVAAACGLTSMSDSVAMKRLPESYGFDRSSLPCGGLLIPYFDTEDGATRYRLRFRHTRITTSPVEGSHYGEETKELPKFLTSAGCGVLPYFPPRGMPKNWKADVSVPLFFTEGPIKALALVAARYPSIGLGGVEAGFHDVAEWHQNKNLDLHPLLRRVRWTGRTVYLVSDAGRLRNPSVARGEARLALLMMKAGATVRLVELPFVDGHDVTADLLYDSRDQGPDDFLDRCGRKDFQKVVEAAVPADPVEQVKAAPDADACRRLLSHLPFQAALSVGGQRVVGPVAAEMKKQKFGISATAVKEAVAEYEGRARSQARDPLPEWADALTRTAAGAVKGTVGNGITILSNDAGWSGVLAYDQFAETTVLRKEPPWGDAEKPAKPFVEGQPLEEEDASRVVAWMERRYECVMSSNTAHEVLEVVAHANAYHPVRDYLTGLTWDGVPRVAPKDGPSLFTTYAGAEDTDYIRCVSRWFSVGAVARVMEPGCKLDTMTILEGPQGAKKSGFYNELFGDAWFSDSLSEIGSKDSYQDLRGKWCVELAELDGLSRAEASTAKKFLAKRSDNYRPSYGRRNRDVPRQNVFAGTVNLDAYLKDFTGNRRFHPVRCGTIDLDALRRDRDQLFAEALHLYRQGVRWWPEGAEVELCKDEQDERRQRDPWEAAIKEALHGRDETTTADVLRNVFAIPLDQQHRGHETRVGQAMVALGWSKHRRRLEDGSREYFYLRPGADPMAHQKKKPTSAPDTIDEEITDEDIEAMLAAAQSSPPSANIIQATCTFAGTSTTAFTATALDNEPRRLPEDCDQHEWSRATGPRGIGRQCVNCGRQQFLAPWPEGGDPHAALSQA